MKLWTLLFFCLSVNLCAQIDINIRWDRSRGDVTPRLLGFNIWDGYDDDVATNPQYQENITYMAPGLIRFHSSESTRDSGEHSRGWVDAVNKTWDADKINAVLGACENLQAVQMNISNWPDFISSGNLPKNKFDDYAQWCADLVKLVNIDLGYNIKYWAAFNEAENNVEGNAAGLAELHNKCAVAMKAVDPTILIGGGEWTQPWDNTMDIFIRDAKNHLDFFTYHHYVTGDSQKPDAEIFDAARGMADRVGGIQSILQTNGIGHIPIWITENNVYWTWDVDKRGFMRGIKGAIFNALLLKYYAEGGKLDGSAIWNDSDNTYGVMGGDYAKRPNTHLIMLKNNYLIGTTVSTTSRTASIVNAMSVIAPTSNAVLLINQTAQDTSVNINNTNWTPSGDTVERHSITQTGYRTNSLPLMDETLTNLSVDGYSIVLLRFQAQTDVETPAEQSPQSHSLFSAYPNPFNPTTRIQFTLPGSSFVNLDVFDINGKHITSLLAEKKSSGQHQVTWTATNLTNGVYLLQLESEHTVQFIKVTLIK